MNTFHVMGLMSGSSLDGLDICEVIFTEIDNQWSFEIQNTHCYPYETSLQKKLRDLPAASAYEFAEMHTRFSQIQAQYVQDFFQKYPSSKNIDLIVSHGQTIFHQPEKSFTTQIGCGATLSALTNKKVVSDLRTYDVALGGQGAPLVPFGEKYLFHPYQSFLNIGGICNIALHQNHEIKAYDVCPGNTLLNLLAQLLGYPYDESGAIAKKGKIHQELLQQLSTIEFYNKPAPKSLGTEHIMQDWWQIIESYNIPTEDKLCTVVEHIALQLSHVLKETSTLVTGGGALNTFLMERLQYHKIATIIPSKETVEFKEALIIAFVGLMRFLGKNNFLSSVTGASRDSIGGAIYG